MITAYWQKNVFIPNKTSLIPHEQTNKNREGEANNRTDDQVLLLQKRKEYNCLSKLLGTH